MEFGGKLKVDLISPEVIAPIQHLKVEHLGSKNPRMHTDELLIALSICAVTDEYASMAMEELNNLRGSQIHSTVILAHVDEKTFKTLSMNITCEAKVWNI
jgi:uncharacterized protein (UPF0371 family)